MALPQRQGVESAAKEPKVLGGQGGSVKEKGTSGEENPQMSSSSGRLSGSPSVTRKGQGLTCDFNSRHRRHQDRAIWRGRLFLRPLVCAVAKPLGSQPSSTADRLRGFEQIT